MYQSPFPNGTIGPLLLTNKIGLAPINNGSLTIVNNLLSHILITYQYPSFITIGCCCINHSSNDTHCISYSGSSTCYQSTCCGSTKCYLSTSSNCAITNANANSTVTN